MVGLANLAAMCKHVSGVCHRFTMDEPSKSARFVRVTYSNPDEYGNDRPVTALYPLIRDCYGKGEHTAILKIHRVINASDSLLVIYPRTSPSEACARNCSCWSS
jgi:hypothetical protein